MEYFTFALDDMVNDLSSCTSDKLAGVHKSIRLAALFSHPIQYFAPLFRTLATRSEIDLTVYYCSRQGVDEYRDTEFGTNVKWDIPLLEGYQSRFLPNWRHSLPVGGVFSLINPSIVSELRKERYDAILIHGYSYLTNWLAFFAAKVVGTAILLHGESHLLDVRRPVIRISKEVLLRSLMKWIDAGLYIGSRNHEFYKHYGLPEGRLHFAPYTVDNAFFQRKAIELSGQRQALRLGLGVSDDRPMILFVGKLIPKKQPLQLLRAFAQVRCKHECALVFVGDGVSRSEIEQTVVSQAIPDVRITGFLNQSDLPKAYAAGDLLVLPSAWGETWGLVVNEVMNFGLPVIVSNKVGCASDLVHEGLNGCVVPWNDLDALVNSLEVLVSDASLRHSFGQHSLDIIKGWSIEHTANGIVQTAARNGVFRDK